MDRGYGSACGFRVWIGALHFDSQQTLSFVPARSRRPRRHAGMQARRHTDTQAHIQTVDRKTNRNKQTNQTNKPNKQTNKKTKKKTNKQTKQNKTNKPTNRQTDKPTNRQTDKPKNRQTDKPTDKQTQAKPKNKCGPSFGTRAIMALLERRDALLNGKGDWELKAGRGRNPLSLVPNAGGHSYMSCCLRAKTQCALPHCHTHWHTHTHDTHLLRNILSSY